MCKWIQHNTHAVANVLKWVVVHFALRRAYPLQLADTVDRARTVCPGATEEELCHTWALQVGHCYGTG
jgi:hypothetical protein